MGLVYSSVVDAPRDEVFAWHARPGAFLRLSPPWQPMRVIAEADSLADGRAVLALPGGLRWVAEHQPDGYDPPRRFVDTMRSQPDGLRLPARIAVRWRHDHEFEDVGDGTTRVIDRVETPVPERWHCARCSSTGTASWPTTSPRTSGEPQQRAAGRRRWR